MLIHVTLCFCLIQLILGQNIDKRKLKICQENLSHIFIYIGTLINISILGEDWGGGVSVLRGLNRPFGSPLEDRALYKNMGK